MAMELNDYCDNVTRELSGWKEKMDGIVRKFDHVSTGDKERVVNEVNELHIIADELYDRIEGLKKACMTSWKPVRDDHDVVWPEQSQRTWSFISQSDIGG